MLYAEPHELEPIRASDKKPCTAGCGRIASWVTDERSKSGRRSPFCGWCVCYSNRTEWGYKNRAELAQMGGLCRNSGLANESTHVPKLDERHRLDPADVEKLLMGVVFTSKSLRNKLRPALQVGARTEVLDEPG